ncbi:MAG: hypothetical protein AB1765_03985 [Candidatus Hydrogenedentota bacterium]
MSDTGSKDLSRKNYYIISGGLFCVIVGFWILSLVNDEATNIASYIAPPLIIAGYIIIGIGILI